MVLPRKDSSMASDNNFGVDFNRALQNQLSERQRRLDESRGVQRIWSRKQIEQAFLETFEMIGGVPRLAIWANETGNYGEFLKLLLKFAPKEVLGEMAGQVLEYRSNVPASSLNKPKVEEIADGEIVSDDGNPTDR